MDPGRYVIPSLVSTSTGTDHSGFAYYYILCIQLDTDITMGPILRSAGAPTKGLNICS